MKKARRDTACVVFEGRIVVSGGYSSVDSQILNTVEVYDVFADEWSTMTSLNRRRRWHQMVVVRDNLFVIGNEPTHVKFLIELIRSLLNSSHQAL